MLEQLRSRLVRQGPSLLRMPLAITPFAVQRQLLLSLLNVQFRQALAEGELDFLEARWLEVEVRDLGLRWYITLAEGQLVVSEQADADVRFSADANDLILVAARRCDPDTLFFQRRLSIEGDTELGLYVKNLIDAIDLDTLPSALRRGLVQLADFIEAGLREGAVTAHRAVNIC